MDWGGIIPAVNLLVLLISGISFILLLRSGISQALEVFKEARDHILSNTTKISQIETTLQVQQKEIERMRERLDRFLDAGIRHSD